nr:nucleotide-binding alpha-beta plait domain-containing protein [Tanacetum cinerariifolium]
LFHACKQYGHVVDSFIPSKRAKDGKQFGCVRFINVFSVERLVNNLCTIWVERLKLNANVTRFNRENLKSSRIVDKTEKRFNKSSHNTFRKTVRNKDIGNSFVNVVKGSGFDVLNIGYLGELWVLIEFESAKVKDLFKENGGANSWFSVLNQAYEDFTLGGRIAWVEVEGIPFKLWSGTLNEGHLDEGCAKKVNEEVARDDNSFVHTIGGKENSGSVNKMPDSMGSCRLKKSGMPWIKLMIVVVYAPQEASEKRMLWGY